MRYIPLKTGEDVKEQFKPLTESTVRKYADAQSYERGEDYSESGAIYNATLRGQVLIARSMGQSGGPYWIRVNLVPVGERSKKPIKDFSCSCPRGDFCKHIVALLLIWIRAPEDVQVRPDVMARLRGRSQAELLAILTDILDSRPGLYRVVERSLLRPRRAK